MIKALLETHTWPMEKSIDVGQAFVKSVQDLPPYIKMIGPFISFGGDGVKACTIHDVEKGHEEEGFLFISKMLVEFSNIGGQRFHIRAGANRDRCITVSGTIFIRCLKKGYSNCGGPPISP